MPRTTIEVPYTAPFRKVDQAIRNYMTENGYNEVEHDGELCYKKGATWWNGVQAIKPEYSEDTVRLSAWVEYNFFTLKSRGAPLRGFIGVWSKAQAKFHMDKLEEEIRAMKE